MKARFLRWAINLIALSGLLALSGFFDDSGRHLSWRWLVVLAVLFCVVLVHQEMDSEVRRALSPQGRLLAVAVILIFAWLASLVL